MEINTYKISRVFLSTVQSTETHALRILHAVLSRAIQYSAHYFNPSTARLTHLKTAPPSGGRRNQLATSLPTTRSKGSATLTVLRGWRAPRKYY